MQLGQRGNLAAGSLCRQARAAGPKLTTADAGLGATALDRGEVLDLVDGYAALASSAARTANWRLVIGKARLTEVLA